MIVISVTVAGYYLTKTPPLNPSDKTQDWWDEHFCRHCGNKLEIQPSKFCDRCGKRVSS